MQRDEFTLLINRELTYVYSYLNRIERAKKESYNLYMDIEEYLSQK